MPPITIHHAEYHFLVNLRQFNNSLWVKKSIYDFISLPPHNGEKNLHEVHTDGGWISQ